MAKPQYPDSNFYELACKFYQQLSTACESDHEIHLFVEFGKTYATCMSCNYLVEAPNRWILVGK